MSLKSSLFGVDWSNGLIRLSCTRFYIIVDAPAKLLNPSVTMAVWWTKQSPDPSLGAMNPKPLVTSKNFTLPALWMIDDSGEVS